MEKLRIHVCGTDIHVTQLGDLTTGMVGATASFSFSQEWNGLLKTAVFCGGIKKDVILTGNTVKIPPECLRSSYMTVGVYGHLPDGTVVIPTVMSENIGVGIGAKPSGDTQSGFTPDKWMQLLGMIGDLSMLTTEDKSTLVAAVNEVLSKVGTGGGGGAAGVGIQSIEQTASSTEDGGVNTWRVTLTDGSTTDITLRNGSKGSQGEPGATGATPNLQIGTVETLEAGSDATASFSGTPENPLLNLGIPKGGGGGEWKKVTTIQFATDVLSYELDISAYSEWLIITTSASDYSGGILKFRDANIYNFILFKNVNNGIHVIINKNKWVCATCQRGNDALAQLHTLPCSNTDTMIFQVGSMTTPGAIDVYGR